MSKPLAGMPEAPEIAADNWVNTRITPSWAAPHRVGDVVRASETDFRLVEYFDPRTNQCTLTPTCRLKAVFSAALRAYFKELDGMTLADIVEPAPAPASGRAESLRRPSVIAPVTAPRSLRKPAGTGKSHA